MIILMILGGAFALWLLAKVEERDARRRKARHIRQARRWKRKRNVDKRQE